MKNIILSILLFLFFSFQALAETPITTKELADKIKNIGAKETINELFKNNEFQWNYVLNKISSGEKDWLTIATLLVKGSDADSSETLIAAVANAISNNPEETLSILNENNNLLTIENVCSLPFYNKTEIDYNQYFVNSIRKLYKIANSKNCIDTMVNTIGKSNNFVYDN